MTFKCIPSGESWKLPDSIKLRFNLWTCEFRFHFPGCLFISTSSIRICKLELCTMKPWFANCNQSLAHKWTWTNYEANESSDFISDFTNLFRMRIYIYVPNIIFLATQLRRQDRKNQKGLWLRQRNSDCWRLP